MGQVDAPGQADPPRPKSPPHPPLDYNEYKPAPTDLRVCGCTIHQSHGDCTFKICQFNHCGYIRQPTTVNVSFDCAVQIDDPMADARRSDLRRELSNWWIQIANVESTAVADKAVEYGSRDLIEIGYDLARIAGRIVDDQQAAELGVYFYLRGKLARWTEAVADGRTVSDDTLTDIGVYVRMAQRIRTHGGWPGKAE
jgi:hypothetical protein